MSTAELAPSSAADYLRSKYRAFQDLGPRILDLQHRAALAKQQATQLGQPMRAELAGEAVVQLGDLLRFHQETLNRLEALVTAIPGLGAFWIPVTLVASAAAIAASVALVFRLFDPLERMVTEVLEREDLTPEQQTQLIQSISEASQAGTAGGFVSELGDAARWVGFGLLAWLAYNAWKGYQR